MGGGSKQSSSNQTFDNDVMASDSAVVIAEGGEYSAVDVGMGATVLGQGANHIEDNEGTIFGDNADINYGVQVGENSSFVQNSMDERTQELIGNAMTLMYANTENVLNAHAADAQELTSRLESMPTFLGGAAPEPEKTEDTKPLSKSQVGAGITGLILLAIYMKGRNNNAA